MISYIDTDDTTMSIKIGHHDPNSNH